MNAAISALVAIVCVGVVLGASVLAIDHVIGEWSVLVWVIAGWMAFMAIMKAVNS